MSTAKLTAVGDGLGFILPAEEVQRLQGAEGDEFRLIPTPKGISLQRVDANTAKQIDIASQVMEERRDALRRLAE